MPKEESDFRHTLEYCVLPYIRRMFSPKMIYRNVKYGIQNLVRWFPVIWTDRDWDHIYLFIMLRYKLRGMENLLRKYGYHVNAEAEADNIRKCILILNRIIDDVYYDIAFRFHEQKWGELDMSLERGHLHLFRKNVTPETIEQERSEFRKCCELEKYLIDQDLQYLFNFMSKHIKEWWD